MDKEAGLVPGPLKVLLNRMLRSKASPLSDYFANIARKGMEAGFEGRTETMLPSTGAMALSTLGPSTGVLDHVIGTQIGHELRHATDKARQRLAVTHPPVAAALEHYDPKFQDIVNLLNPAAGAVRSLPISKRNYRRLKRFVSSEISNPVARAALQSQNPLVGAVANYGVRQATTSSAPLIRNMARAVQGPGPSPLAERVARSTIKSVAPHHNAEMMLAATGAPAAMSVLTGAMNPLGAITSMALPLAEAALIRKAEQGRAGSLTSLKMRLIGNMAEPKPGVGPFLERSGQRVWSAFDPNVDEFSRVGADINKVRRVALATSSKLTPEQAVRARTTIDQATGALNEQGSVSAFGKNLAHDFDPEIQTVKRVAKATAAAPGVAARAVGTAGKAVLPDMSALSSPLQHMQNLQAPQQRAGFVNFMEAGKMAAVRHHLPCVTVQRHDGKVKICPHCHQEVTEGSIYRDAKGWCFHRPCFMKGKGSIDMGKEGSVALSEPNKEEETPGALTRLGYGGMAAGAAAGIGAMGFHGYHKITPSLLDLSHRMLQNNPEAFTNALVARHGETGRKLIADASNSKWLFTKLVSGMQVPGVDPTTQKTFQDLALGNKGRPVIMHRQGDINLRDPVPSGKAMLLGMKGLTGMNFIHAETVGSPEHYYDYSPMQEGAANWLQGPVPTGKIRRGGEWEGSYVRMRPKAITESAAAKPNVVRDVYAGAADAAGYIPYGMHKNIEAQLHEYAPELTVGGYNLPNRAIAGAQRGFLGSRTAMGVAKAVLPSAWYNTLRKIKIGMQRDARAGCKPGQLCSGLTAQAVNTVQPGAIEVPPNRTITPGDLQRMAGGALEPVEVHLQPRLRNPGFLIPQHLAKYGPLALRALPIAGLTAAGTYAGYKALSPFFNKKKPEEEIKKIAEAPVIHERQTNDYNCGPAVLKAVENTMGIGHPNIKTYEAETGANDDDGTPITHLEATAAKHGLKVNSFGQMDANQLSQATQAGKPVIVAMQMDGEEGGPKGGWEAGHYVVVTGVDGQNVKFMDPSSEAPERTLPLNEFLGRWHDHDHNGKVYKQWGMTLQHPAEVKQAYSGSLGSGATSGQGTDPPRLVDASGSTPAGPENQPASDAVPCDSTHLDNCDQHPDPLVFNMADLEKMASRWSQEIASGNMSPRAMSRIMTTRPEGSFVKIKNIGHGGMNVADLGAGNVGGHAGLMVRKLPQYAPIVPGETVPNPLYKSSPAEPAPSSALARLISGAGLRQPEVPKELPKPQGLAALYGPTVEASQELDRRAPGKSLRYLGATSKGIFQEYDAGKGSIVPRQTLLGRLFGRDTEMAHMLNLRREVGEHGFQDIKPANLGPSGRIIDFTREESPNAMLRGMVTYGEGLEIKPETVLPKQFAKLQARQDKIYAEIANPVGQRAAPIMLQSIAALNRERSELAQEAYRRFHLQRAKHIPDAAPVMAQHTPRPEPTDPGLLRRGWEQAKAEVGSLKTHASDIGHAALPLAAPAALVALVAGNAYYQHQQEKKEKKKRRQEKSAIAPFETMSVGTEETQEPSDNTGAQWTGHGRDNSGSSPWKDRLREIADSYEAHQDSSSAGAGGRTQAPSGPGFQTGQSAQNSGATSAPEADGPSMQLDSDTISTGQVPHLNA